MSPILRVVIAVLFGGMAAWFLRYRFDRGEPAHWFFTWLVTAAAAGAFSAVSWWVGDETISRSFWIVHAMSLSLGVFLIFGFTRSFGSKVDYTLLLWSLPLMFDLAVIIVDSQFLYRRSGDTWVPRADNAFFYVHLALNIFYIIMSLYYCFMVYAALRSQEQKEEAVRFRYIFAGLLVIFVSVSVADQLRGTMNPAIPIAEIGSLLGAALLLIGVVEPKAGFLGRKKQGVA